MNDLKDTPTADLITEWVRLEELRQHIEPFKHYPQFNAIASELDRRATDAGIAIYENQFVYNTTEFWITHTRNLEHDIMTLAANGNITAKEQHDLEAWLLLKEGGRGA